MRRLGKLKFLPGVILALPLLVHAAIWYESYLKAVRLLEDKQWAAAIPLLEEAIRLKTNSEANARTYGVNFEDYFPYLKLGIANYHLGQLDAALRWLDREEQLRAISKSPTALAELRQVREDIKKAQESAAAALRARTQTLVSESLDEAGRAEAQGNLDEALAAANKALAIAPDDQAVKDILTRIQDRITATEKRRDQEARRTALVEEGNKALDAGQLQVAASNFTEALAITDSPDVRSLLEKAQSRLRDQIAAVREQQSKSQQVAEIVKTARTLQAQGRLNDALAKLQEAVVLEPASAEVKALQQTLVVAQTAVANANAQDKSIRDLLADAQLQYNFGNFDKSLASANRVRALAPGNQTAIDIASKSIDALNQERLKQKPSIVPRDRRDFELQPNLSAERTHSPIFELQGSVNYPRPVNISVTIRYLGRVRDLYAELDKPDPTNGQPALSEVPIRTENRPDAGATDYVASHTLRPGLSLFTVKATDPADPDKSQTSQYPVYYVIPFYKAKWFWGFVGGFTLLTAATYYGLRQRRLRQHSKRRFNPYVAGAPVLQEELFFGREQLLKRVLQSVHNNSIMLYGERRIGKTSFQHFLKRRLARLDDPEYSFYPVYVDLQGVPEERFFSTLRDEVYREYAPILPGVQGNTGSRPDSAYDYRDFVEDIREALKALRARTKKKVKLVLQMDEVDQLNGYDPRVNQRLRSLFMRDFAENLAAVVSGVAIQKRWEGEGSPWYNFFEEIEVPPLVPEDATRLIELPVKGKFKLEKGVAERVISATGCKPYLIQKICIALINRMHDAGRREVLVEDVDVVGRFMEI